jgi:hypothetical protein
MSSTNQENYTVSLGGQTTLQCAVRSLGPTQIQWLKQLHDHQAPTDRNRTIVVFDFIFEVRNGSFWVATDTTPCKLDFS